MGAAVVALAVVAGGVYFAVRPDSVAGVAAPGPASAPPTDQLPSAPPPAPVVASAPEADAKSIAVLPFENRSAEKENEYFADGVHEDLLTALAKVRDLKVIARSSVLGYRDTTKRNLREIARELGVAHILEGSVRRAGGKARISVQLIDARTGAQLWAESYDRDVTDIFAVQGEVAREITSALKATLRPDEATLISRRLTSDPRAYDLYVRGRALEQNLAVFGAREEYDRITNLYASAAATDPSFMLAHVQEAIMHGTQYWFSVLDPTEERRERAFAALERARALAPDAPEVRFAQGALAYLCRNDWRAALVDFRKAQAELPNDAQLLYRMALSHRRLGEMVEAEQLLQRVVVLNPNDLRGVATLIETQLGLRRHREVVATHARFRALLAGDGQVEEFVLAAMHALSGDTDAYLRRMALVPPRPNDPHGFNHAYNLALLRGELGQAAAVLDDPRWETVLGLGGIVGEPKSLHRAQLAFLQGRTDEAKRFALEAIAYFEGRTWTERQQPVARMGIARALSCAGRHEEAWRAAQEALAQQERLDRFVLSMTRYWAGRVALAAGRPDDALAQWRAYAAKPGSWPAEVSWQLDPWWRRLRGDPRYAEIFRPLHAF